jgi:hypothetical protein
VVVNYNVDVGKSWPSVGSKRAEGDFPSPTGGRAHLGGLRRQHPLSVDPVTMRSPSGFLSTFALEYSTGTTCLLPAVGGRNYGNRLGR